jgi:hypothetical protein
MLGALVMLASVLAAPVSAAELRGQFMGGAWGNHANAQAGSVSTRLGRAAYQPCPCSGTNGNVRSNVVHDVEAGDVYRAATIRNTAQADKTADARAFGQTTSRVANVSILDGLIRADAVYSVATVRATASAINVSPSGSAIVGLRVNGQAVTVDPGERINLAGFGYATFYNVQRWGDGDTRRGITVEMIRVVITRENALDLPIGAVITVAHAHVGYTRLETDHVVGAAAWGSEASSQVGDIVNRFGRSAPAYLGCFAKGSSSGTNRVESLREPGLINTGTIVNRVYGAVSDNVASASASSRLEMVNLLDGLVTADVIRGVAATTVDGSGGKTSFDGSHFVNLRVMGEEIGDNVAPNTELELLGLGTLTLFSTESRRDADEAHASVWMVILEVTVPNAFDLPVGTVLRLGRARAMASQP